MCGIAGIIGPAQAREDDLDAMLRALRHRGPDDTGTWNSGDTCLGINRLSIIDINGPPPPHWNEDHTCCVICNGEIYNYRELRSDLQQKGHRFRTNSDTEVIVHLYEAYGEHAPEYLQGMFAFAVYDIPRRRLLLARDRFGEKPLFYYHKNGDFAFASEINGLLALPDLERRLNRPALAQFLECRAVREPDTLLEHVYSLPPGHTLCYSAGNITQRAYFHLQYAPDPGLRDLKTATAAFEPVWQQAIRRQLLADVPVAALLSGGLDSSAIVAAMAEQSTAPVKTFHIRLAGAQNDESGIARTVARHFGTEHHEIALPDQGFDEALFWTILDHTGMPFADAAALPFYLISREVRKQVKVVMSGDGGDEMFAGYDYYRWGMQVAALAKMPAALRSIALGSLRALREMPGAGNIPLRTAIKALEGAALPPSSFFPWYFGLFTKEEVGRMCKTGADSSAWLPESAEWNAMSPLRQMMWFSTQYNLPLDMLVKTDRMGMANSLEVRAPFLDVGVADFAATLPDALLSNWQQGKLVLREMLKNKLPATVLAHRKTGFVTPLHRYWNDNFRRLARELIAAPGPLDAILNKAAVLQFVETGLTQTRDNNRSTVFRSTHQLWLLVQLYAWVKRFGVRV